MKIQSPILLGLSLVETGGPFGDVGWPVMHCWLSAVYVPGTSMEDARISVLTRADSTQPWCEYARDLSLADAQRLMESLERLGIPGKTLDVEGAIDTSESWSRVFFRVVAAEQTFELDIAMESSGFRGPDAEGLRAVFRQVFSLAGYSNYSPVIYGRRAAATQDVGDV